MEISDPVPEMIIPVTSGKRTLELRLRTRAECRELIRAAFLASLPLPDDGEGTLMLFADAPRPSQSPAMSLPELIANIGPMNRTQLRHVIGAIHEINPHIVTGPVLDMRDDTWAKAAPDNTEEPYCGKLYRLPSGEADWCAEPAGHDGDCGDQPRNQFPVTPFASAKAALDAAEILADSIDEGAKLAVYADDDADDMGDDPTDVSGMHDDGLEDAAAAIAPAPGNGEPCACGHHYGLHLYGHGCCLQAGCRCRRYRIAAVAAQDEDDDLSGRALYEDDEPDEAAILAAGELAAAEVDEARSRERLSDSAVGPLAEDEPDEAGDPECTACGLPASQHRVCDPIIGDGEALPLEAAAQVSA